MLLLCFLLLPARTPSHSEYTECVSESVFPAEYLAEKLELDMYISSGGKLCCATCVIALIAVWATWDIFSAKLELGWELEGDEYSERKLPSRLTVADRDKRQGV